MIPLTPDYLDELLNIELSWLERVLKFDPNPEARAEAKARYLALSSPREATAFQAAADVVAAQARQIGEA